MCISYSETEPVATKVEKERRVRVHVSAPLNNKGQMSTHRITMQRALIRATPHQAVRRAMGWPAWRWRADSGPSSRIKASARGITQARVPLAKSPIVACPSSIQDPIRVYAVLERPEVPANLPADRFTSFSPPEFWTNNTYQRRSDRRFSPTKVDLRPPPPFLTFLLHDQIRC